MRVARVPENPRLGGCAGRLERTALRGSNSLITGKIEGIRQFRAHRSCFAPRTTIDWRWNSLVDRTGKSSERTGSVAFSNRKLERPRILDERTSRAGRVPSCPQREASESVSLSPEACDRTAPRCRAPSDPIHLPLTVNDAMILPYEANPGRMEFSERTRTRAGCRHPSSGGSIVRFGLMCQRIEFSDRDNYCRKMRFWLLRGN